MEIIIEKLASKIKEMTKEIASMSNNMKILEQEVKVSNQKVERLENENKELRTKLTEKMDEMHKEISIVNEKIENFHDPPGDDGERARTNTSNRQGERGGTSDTASWARIVKGLQPEGQITNDQMVRNMLEAKLRMRIGNNVIIYGIDEDGEDVASKVRHLFEDLGLEKQPRRR